MSLDLYKTAEIYIGVKEPDALIKTFFREGVGINKDHKTAWCSAFANFVARKCDYERTSDAWAKSWLKVGRQVSPYQVKTGDIVVFHRGKNKDKGHVGFFGKWLGKNKFTAISGNYSQMVRDGIFYTDREVDGMTFICFRRLDKIGPFGKIKNTYDDFTSWGDEQIDNVKDFFSPDSVNTEVNRPAYQPIINKVKYQPKELKPIPRTKIKEVKQVPAAGIWNIIKFVADQYSLSQTINDATINNNQGSLYNFIQKVVQKPWLQFFGTTLNSRYYFYCRKEPFDFEGWQNMPTIKVIKEENVLSDNFKWYDGDVYSWYQLTPRGNFYTEQHLQFGYISAVFFEEFADVWGSKPLSQISNYVNYYKTPDEEKEIMHKKAMIDLKYMVESNCYLPFTRQGTITIDGDTSFKPGYKVEVESTQEIFYIDNVSHNFVNDEGNVRFVTTLQLSRGMKKKFIAYPKSKDTISYFNIINFDMKFEQLPGVSEEYKKPIVNWKVNRKVFDFFINKRQNGL